MTLLTLTLLALTPYDTNPNHYLINPNLDHEPVHLEPSVQKLP